MFIWMNDDLSQDLLDEARRRYVNASMELRVSEGVWRSLAVKHVEAKVADRKITEGDRIMVLFSNGSQECIYEGVCRNAFKIEVGVILRHMTKAGPPCKRCTDYGVNVIPLMVPLEEE